MENCWVSELHEVPNNNKSLIVKVELLHESGKFVFDNGTSFEFLSKAITQIKQFNCASFVEIFSTNAARSFVAMDHNGRSYWTDALRDVTAARFGGNWDPFLLAHLIANATNLRKLSCTYWGCQNIPQILEAVGDPQYNDGRVFHGLEELSIHVDIRQIEGVIDSIDDLGDKFGCTLKCLTLVFDNVLFGNPATHYESRLCKAIGEGAQITMLFAGGGDVGTLVKEGFTEDGHVRVAANTICFDDSASKKFDVYNLYTKTIGGVEIIVGARFGNPRFFSSFRYQICHYPEKDEIKIISLQTSNPYLSYPTYNIGDLPDGQYYNAKFLKVYSFPPEMPALDDTIEQPNGQWKMLNGTYPVRIRKLIYHQTWTEFFTSNGFYIVLDDMCDEASFLDYVNATDRFVLHCTTSHRRSIVFDNMFHFLETASHIEFIGMWHGSIVEMFATLFTPQMTALTMVQFELHTRSCLRNFFTRIPIKVRENLKVFHYDGRATKDKTIGSIINAILNAGILINGEQHYGIHVKMMFTDLLIIGNSYEGEFYKCRLFMHVADLKKIMLSGGSATTVVNERASRSWLVGANFTSNFFNVLAPLAYPYRRGGNRSTALMSGIECTDPFAHIYLVLPWVRP